MKVMFSFSKLLKKIPYVLDNMIWFDDLVGSDQIPVFQFFHCFQFTWDQMAILVCYNFISLPLKASTAVQVFKYIYIFIRI